MDVDVEREAFSKRLNNVLDEASWPQRGRQVLLGKQFGVSQNGARKWLEAESIPKTTRIREIAAHFNISASWLLTGKADSAPVSTVPTLTLLDYKQAANPSAHTDGDFMPIDVELADQLSEQAFALKVADVSMEPDFKPGDTLIIDPKASIHPGDIVVAKLESEDQVTVRKYRARGQDEAGEVFELVPLNDDYPTNIVDKGHPGALIGKVIEHRRKLP